MSFINPSKTTINSLNSSSSNIKGNYDPQLGKLVHPQISMNTNFLEVNASSLSDQNSELLFSRSPFYHVNKKYTKHSKKNRIIIVYSDKYNPMAPGWPLPIMFLNEDDLKHIVLDNKTLKLNGFVKEGGFWEWLQKLTYNAYQQYSEEILKATISQSFKEAYENNEPVSRKVDTKHFGKQVNLNTGLRSQLNNRSLMGYASLGCLSCPTMGSSASISAAAVSPGVLVSSGYSWPNFGQKIKMASKQFTGLCNTVKLLQPRAKPKPPPPPCKVDVKAVSGAFMEGKTWGFGLRGAHTIHARAGQIIDLQATGNPSGGTFFYQFTQPKRGSAVQHGHKGKASFLSYRDGKYTATVYYVLPGNRMCKKEFVILVR